MPNGGHLQVTTSLAPPLVDGVRRAPGEGESGWVRIDVGDTGQGIGEEELKDVFSPFFTTKTYGTELGLTISRKIIRDHGGDLTIHSEPHKGTTVSIHIPVSNPPSEGRSDETDPDRR